MSLILPQGYRSDKIRQAMIPLYGWANYTWSRDLPFEHERDTVFALGIQSGPHDVGFSATYFDKDVDGSAEWTYGYWQLFQPYLNPVFIFDVLLFTDGGAGSGVNLYGIQDGVTTWNPGTLTWNNQPAVPATGPRMSLLMNDVGATYVPPSGDPGVLSAQIRGTVKFDCRGWGPISGIMMRIIDGAAQNSCNIENAWLYEDGSQPHRFLKVVSRSSVKEDKTFDPTSDWYKTPTQTLTFDTEHHFNPYMTGNNPTTSLISIAGVDPRYDSTAPFYFGHNQTVHAIQFPDSKSVKFPTLNIPMARTGLGPAAFDEATTPCQGLVEVSATGY